MNRKTKRVPWLVLLFLCLSFFAGGEIRAQAAEATGIYRLTVDGKKNYEMAYEVLEYVNEERASLGLNKLVMDQELLDAAMQRAAETGVYFDDNHRRPDLRSCYTVNSKVNAENIAGGYHNAKEAFEGWRSSFLHYDNMMGKYWVSTGIGCVRVGNVYYWVQEFSSKAATAASTTGDQNPITVQIGDFGYAADALCFNLNEIGYGRSDTVEIKIGENDSLKVGRENRGWGRYTYYAPFVASSFIWKSSNPSAVRVDSTGKVTATGVGTAKITATPKNILSGTVPPATVTYRCVQSLEDAAVAEIPDQTYTGRPQTPKLTVSLKGKTLKEGTDYKVEYSDNTNVYTYSEYGYRLKPRVWIIGIGNYGGSITRTFNILPLDTKDQFDVKVKGWDTAGYDDIAKGLAAQIEVSYKGKVLSFGYGNADYYFSSYSPSGTKVTSFTVKLDGNYVGCRSFVCLGDYTVKVADQKYTGKPLTPEVKVYASSWMQTPLEKDVDYTVSYRSNTNRGTATVIITGKGTYYGTITTTFTIGCRHKWSAWKTTKAPTALAVGVKTRTCSICEATQRALIAKLTPTLTLSHTKATVNKGKMLTVTVKAKTTGDYVVSWKSSNPSVVTVTKNKSGSGTIKAVGAGSAVVTCTMKSGLKKQIPAAVLAPTTGLTVRCTGAALRSGKIIMNRNSTARLTVSRQPVDVTDALVFSSSNPNVVSVTSGGGYLRTYYAKGTARITVRSGAKTAVITVTVK